jgi:hypothetical protein
MHANKNLLLFLSFLGERLEKNLKLEIIIILVYIALHTLRDLLNFLHLIF